MLDARVYVTPVDLPYYHQLCGLRTKCNRIKLRKLTRYQKRTFCAVSEAFKARKGVPLKTKAFSWLREQVPLMEAFFVAVSIHVVLFPTMWFIGWALPWPKPPVVTVIFEYDLQQWAKNPSVPPKRIIDIRDPRRNQ